MVRICAKGIRKLPPWIIRSMLAFDLAMGCLNPAWGWWVLYRCTGEPFALSKYIPIYIDYVRFCGHHLTHHGGHTGFFNADWFAAPRSESFLTETKSLSKTNPCGTCINCCTTFWRKNPARCPFLADDGFGCRVYKKIYWDYTNCGRYPHSQSAVSAYQCPRFS